MPTVTEDIIEGHTLTLGKDGFSVQRVFNVAGVAGNAPARCYTAINTPGVPQRGDFHPDIPGIRAETLSAVPLDTSTVLVTVTYTSFRVEVQPPEAGTPPSIQVGSSVQEVTTNLDIDGAVIKVTHTYEDKDADGNITTRTVEQGGEVTVQIPLTVLRYTRRETTDPHLKAIRNVGKLNHTTFIDDPARYWLCTRIEGSSDDGGATYTVTYEFQRNPNTWDATVVFIDPETDKPPTNPDPVDGEGIKTFQVYDTTDFNALGLGV